MLDIFPGPQSLVVAYHDTLFDLEKVDHFGQKQLCTRVQGTGLGKQNGASTIL